MAMPLVMAYLFSHLNNYDKRYGYTETSAGEAQRIWNDLRPETKQSFVEKDCLLLEQMRCGNQAGIRKFVHDVLVDSSETWYSRGMFDLTTRQSALELEHECLVHKSVEGFIPRAVDLKLFAKSC